MTATEKFMEDAVAGGWRGEFLSTNQRNKTATLVVWEALLSPLAWQAVGKTRGNPTIPENHCRVCGEPMPEGETMFFFHGYSSPCPKPPLKKWEWRDKMHRFIDHLADGKSIEEALSAIKN